MILGNRRARVWARSRPTDLRKGYTGLAALVTDELGHDLVHGDLFVFISRRRTSVKVLQWDGTGLCIYSKRLAQGRFAPVWTRRQAGEIQLTMAELALLLEGAVLHRVQALMRKLAAAEERAKAAEERAEAERARAEAEHARAAELELDTKGKDKLIRALMAQVRSLTQRLARAVRRPEQLALELELRAVQQRLDQLNDDTFGSKSERLGRPQGPPKSKPPRKPQTGHGPTPQPDLARDPQLHLLDEADQVCPNCLPPRPLQPWQGHTVDSEEVTVVERTFRVTVHQRQVYRCDGCGHLETALGPTRLVPGGRYSPDFAATVAVDKYRDHLPLERQARRMAEAGLNVTSQALWDQLGYLYVLLLPSYLALQQRILEQPLVYADETTWRLMKKGGSKRWWVWVLTDGRRVFFLLASTRGQAAARTLFGDYAGTVMADRYSVYTALEKARTKAGTAQLPILADDDEALPLPDYDLAACWMHARRGFFRAAKRGQIDALVALEHIRKLYAIEARARQKVQSITDADARAQALLAARTDLRQAQSRPVIDALRAWLDDLEPDPGLALDKAVNWIDNGWKQLVRFLDDPRIPLDNGEAERAIRGAVLGRKTHHGSRSEKGTQVAALFYSLVESCRLAGVDARAYLIEATRRALQDRDTVFLPEDFAAMQDGEASEAG